MGTKSRCRVDLTCNIVLVYPPRSWYPNQEMKHSLNERIGHDWSLSSLTCSRRQRDKPLCSRNGGLCSPCRLWKRRRRIWLGEGGFLARQKYRHISIYLEIFILYFHESMSMGYSVIKINRIDETNVILVRMVSIRVHLENPRKIAVVIASFALIVAAQSSMLLANYSVLRLLQTSIVPPPPSSFLLPCCWFVAAEEW